MKHETMKGSAWIRPHSLQGPLGILALLLFLSAGESRAGSFLPAPRVPVSPRVRQGLVGKWTFAEGGGTTAGDSSSGTGTSGTLRGGVTWTPQGRIGNALNFGGVNGTLDLGSNLSILQNVPAATLSCFLKLKAAVPSGSYQDVISISVNATSRTDTSRAVLSIQGNGTGGNVFLGGRSTDSESQKILVDTTNLTPGTWYHLTGVIDFQNNALKVYVNGVLSSSASVTFTQNTTANTVSTDAALGSQDAGDGNFLNGYLDEVQVYNLGLSASQIQTLASGDNLAAHWSMQEGAGGTAGDSSGNNYNGTLTGGVTWTSGPTANSGLNFDGSTGFVNLSNNLGILQDVNACTVTTWIKPASTMAPGTYRELVSIAVNNGGSRTDTSRVALALKGDGSAGSVFLGARSTDTESEKFLVANTNLQVGTWVHLAGVVDFQGGTLNIYLNGLLVATSSVSFAQPHTPNTLTANGALAAEDTGDTGFFQGAMSEVGVYARPLCSCEIQTLVGGSGLRAYWAFNEGTGTTASDSSGNGFTGTLQGGVGWAVPGLIGNAASFGGTNGTISLGSNLSILQNVPATTIAGWVKLNAAIPSGSYQSLLEISVGGSRTDVSRAVLSIQGNGTGGLAYAGGRSTDTEAQQFMVDTRNISPGTWTHLATTIDFQHNRIQIYVNGALSSSKAVAFFQTSTPNTPSANAAIGSEDSGDGNFMNGQIDELRVYCRVLSAAEILSLATLPPAPPTGLTASGGDHQVSLTWNASTGATSYNVKRSTTSGSGYTQVGMTNTTSFVDSGLQNGTPYFYVVTAENLSGESGNSTQANATPTAPPSPPAAPTGLVATAGNQQVSLTWNASSGATSYNVKRGTSTGTEVTVATVTAPTTSFIDTGRTNGTPYFYVVSALNSAGEGANSTEVTATPNPPGTPPTAPTGLAATPLNAQVLLTWNASTGAVSYNVKRGTSAGGEATVATVTAPTTTFTDSGLTNNTFYFYVVTAVNAAGESGASNEVSARPNVPPASPTGLVAAAGNAQVVLTWNANTETNLTGYNVYTAATQTGPFTQKVNTSLVTTTTFTNTGLTNGTTYFYIVRAVNNSSQESGNSNTASAIPTNSAPGAPVILTPSKKTNSTAPTIVGTAAPSVTIKLFFSGVQESATTTSDVQGNWSLKPATKVDGTYTVTATATNSFGTSAASNAITITVDTMVNPPTNVQAIAQNGQVNLTWTASPDNDIVGYEVWRSDGGGAYHKIHTGVVVGTSFFDFPLTNGTTYCYQVRAVDNTLQEGP